MLDAIDLLASAPAILESGRPWPGELERLKLGNAAGALRSQACEDYRLTLEEVLVMAAETYSVTTRGALDALLARVRRALHRAQTARARRWTSPTSSCSRAALLQTHEVGSRYRERFARVMVDEMQDTNNVQLELIDLVAGLDLVMVGDAQQSIYGFRHADVELFEERGRRLERIGARASLQTNFRSRAEILRALNGAFAEALGESFRPLAPGRQDEPAAEPVVELIVADRDGQAPEPDPRVEQLAAPWRVAEARALAARVRELDRRRAGACRRGRACCCARPPTCTSMSRRSRRPGVPTYVIGGRGYWSHPQVIELVAYLRALANPAGR